MRPCWIVDKYLEAKDNQNRQKERGNARGLEGGKKAYRPLSFFKGVKVGGMLNF